MKFIRRFLSFIIPIQLSDIIALSRDISRRSHPTGIRNSESSVLSRRLFMTTAAAAGAAGAAFSLGKSASGQPKPGKKGKVRWRFEARRVEQSFLDGSTVPFFRYVAVGNTRSNGNLPLMQDYAGRKVSVSINNTLDFPIQPTILEYGTGPVIMPDETAVWTFAMPPEGTWVFTEALLGVAASPAGFAAAMISNNNVKSEVQKDYYLLYQDTDDRWNNAIDNGEVPDETVFEPNYHLLNGLTYPQTMVDRNTRIECKLGEDILIRIANASGIRHALHFHGYHVQLVRRNNQPDNSLPPKDTLALQPFSTSEAVLHVEQVGEFPLHMHSLTSATDNGFYPGGALNLIDAVEN
jgi:hypothetical protein